MAVTNLFTFMLLYTAGLSEGLGSMCCTTCGGSAQFAGGSPSIRPALFPLLSIVGDSKMLFRQTHYPKWTSFHLTSNPSFFAGLVYRLLR